MNFLYRIKMMWIWCVVWMPVILTNRDPMEIIDGKVNPASNIDPIDYLWTDTLFYAVKNFLIIMSAVAMLATLIVMLFVSKSEKFAEKKQDLLHKLLILFIAFSVIPLLKLAKEIVTFFFITAEF